MPRPRKIAGVNSRALTGHPPLLQWKYPDFHEKKDRINRDELADKLVEQAAETEDPLRTMAELITGS